MVIRKFTSRQFTVEDLITRGTLTRPLAEFLSAQIERGQTILISGGTGTGKTTLLNILGQSIPDHERIVVIEDTAELRIEKPNIMAVGVTPSLRFCSTQALPSLPPLFFSLGLTLCLLTFLDVRCDVHEVPSASFFQVLFTPFSEEE